MTPQILFETGNFVGAHIVRPWHVYEIIYDMIKCNENGLLNVHLVI